MGMLYLRGKTWWAKYYIAGHPVRRSCKTEKETVARKLLRHWEGNPHLALPTMDRVTVAGLLDAVVADQEAQGRRSVHHTRRHKADLCAYFTAERKAVSLSRADLDAYVVQRLGQGVSRGTIGRELAVLRRGFRLALENNLVSRVPAFPTLKAGVRTGFVDEETYRRLHAALPDPYNDLLTVGFALGWRRGELLGLRWDQVDVAHGVARLEPGTTKTGEGREVYLGEFPALLDLFRRRHAAARALGIPWVFWRRRGRPVTESGLRHAWQKAKTALGLTLVPHDLRRSAVRNLERAGVPRSVSMKITGHASESIFRRYAITTPADTRPALAKVAALIGYTLGMAETVRAALGEPDAQVAAGTVAGTRGGRVASHDAHLRENAGSRRCQASDPAEAASTQFSEVTSETESEGGEESEGNEP